MEEKVARIVLRAEDFLEMTSDAVIIANQDHLIVLFNQSAEQIFGYSAAEIMGQPLNRLLPERYASIHTRHLENFRASADTKRSMANRGEITGRRKDGSEFPAEASIAKIKRTDQTLFAVILRDITWRKQAEQDLTKWVNAFEHAEWGVVIGEANSNHLQVMNTAFARMHGYSVEELTGRAIQDVYALEERGKVPGWIELAHKKGHISFETCHLRKDGTIFPALVDITAVKDTNGSVLYRVVNVMDITERKNAELALLESEQQNARIVASLEEGVIVFDKNGIILSCNASAERITGVSQKEMVEQNLFHTDWSVVQENGEPYSPDDWPAAFSLSLGQPRSNIIMGLQKPGAALSWVSVNTQPLFHPNETSPYAVLASFSDINERVSMYHLMEERINKSTRELSALLEISRNLTSTLELTPLLKIILEQLKNVVDYTGAAIARLDGEEFTILEYLGPVPREKMLEFRTSTRQDTGYQRVALTRKPYIIDDLWKDDPWLRAFQDQVETQIVQEFRSYHSWMGVPLISQDQFIGVLRIDHIQPDHFTEHHARLVMSFANQAAIAIRNADLYQQAQSLAALEERQKLARELHDSVSQALYGVALGVRTARTLMIRDPEKAIEPLDYCLSLAESGLAEMRALIFELRPESLEVEGIISALYKQAAALKARNSFEVHTEFCEEPDVSLAVKEAIYRIALEAINNISKHAHASRIQVRLIHSDQTLVLEIKDNGQGYNTSQSYPGHLGLHSMRERAAKAGGVLEFISEPGQGTLVRLVVKLPDQ